MSLPVSSYFSKRSRWSTVPNPLGVLQSDKRNRQQAWLDLTESNPTRCRFRFLTTDLLKPLLDPKNLHYEPNARGLLTARQAVCRYYADKKIAVEPDQVFLTASTSEAYGFLFRMVADSGDHLCAPEPGYPLFDTLSQFNDVTLKKYPLSYGRQWQIDLPALEFTAPGARAVIVVNPNNPTGNFISADERNKLNALCLKYGCALIADEVFLDFSWEDNISSESLASNTDALTFTLSGVSKVLGMPQMKLSWIIVSGPPALRQEAMSRLEVIADAALSVNTPSQTALPAWLSERERVRQEILARLRVNLLFLKKHLQKTGAGDVLQAEGGWYAVVRTAGNRNDEENAVRLLDEKNVLVHPGFLFDFRQENYLVLSLIVEDKLFREGVERFCEGLL